MRLPGRALAQAMLVVPALVVAPAVAPPAHAQVSTCRGLAVTIEGNIMGVTAGTPGDDVILAPFPGGGEVDSGAGNDVICVIDAGEPPPADAGFFYVHGGPGDDVIDSSALPAAKRGLVGEGGPGSDTFYGGPASELALVATLAGDPFVDSEPDVFAMGGGADFVESGSTGIPNEDRIDLGPGRDYLAYGGSGEASGGSVVGGAGHDTLTPSAHDLVDPPDDPLPPGEVVFDAGTGTATVGGTPYLSWSGFEEYNLSDVRRDPITFTGSAGDDVLYLGTNVVQQVRMGRGDDVVVNGGWSYPPAGSGGIHGGPGRDRLWMEVDGVVRMDLSREVEVVRDGQRTTLDLSGFEDAKVSGRRVVLFGSNGDNRLVAKAVGSTFVAGRGGDDDLRVGIVNVNPNREALRLASGGVGDDELVGGFLDDVLTGGPGDDRATGLGGTDTCTAEVQVSCER